MEVHPTPLFYVTVDQGYTISLQNRSCVLEDYNCGEFGLLGNFLVSDGNPGKV